MGFSLGLSKKTRVLDFNLSKKAFLAYGFYEHNILKCCRNIMCMKVKNIRCLRIRKIRKEMCRKLRGNGVENGIQAMY